MPKSISDALKTHLAGTPTTMATCWLITRLDGRVFALTDHDQNITYNGTTYLAAAGFTRSAMQSHDTMAVDNLDIVGILDSSAIAVNDLKAGLFDYAQIQIFMLNYNNLSMGIVKLRSGVLGEVIDMPTGTFKTEIRGLTNFLNTMITENYTPFCRADLGDSRCQVPIAPAVWTPFTTYLPGDSPAYYVSDPLATTDTEKLAVYSCTSGGISGGTPPTFNPTVGATTADNGIVWTSLTPLRGVATVSSLITNSNFIASGVTYTPQTDETQAAIIITGNVNLGATLNIQIGTFNQTVIFPTSYNSTDAVNYVVQALTALGATFSSVATVRASFTADNVHSVEIVKNDPYATGNIQKDYDTNNSIEVSNFAGSFGVGDDYLVGGIVQWVTGANAGRSMEIKSFIYGSQNLQLYLAMGFPIAVGDKFYYSPGCDKRRETCRYRFDNMIHFRGEPDLPGLDQMMKYPEI